MLSVISCSSPRHELSRGVPLPFVCRAKDSSSSGWLTWQVLDVLCAVAEYDELPVRHNEDKLNMALSEGVRFPIRERDADDPHAKAKLLLQVTIPLAKPFLCLFWTQWRAIAASAQHMPWWALNSP